MAMYRMQLFIKPEQRKRLERVAKRERCTFSDTARRALEEGLRVMEGDPDIVWKQRLEALEFLNKLRKRIRDKRGFIRAIWRSILGSRDDCPLHLQQPCLGLQSFSTSIAVQLAIRTDQAVTGNDQWHRIRGICPPDGAIG